MSRTVKALLVPADETRPAQVIDLSTELRDVQEQVGGYIELVQLGGGALLVCNEDGWPLDLPMNRRATIRYGFRAHSVLRGDVLVTGTTGSEYADIPEAELAAVSNA